MTEEPMVSLELNPQEIVTVSKILRALFNQKELEWTISRLTDMEKIDVANAALRLTDIAVDYTDLYENYDDEN